MFQVSFYRFSISWSRILPEGNVSDVNHLGIQYYMNMIDALIDAGITPVVVMHYYDMPITIYNQGGWKNPNTIHLFVEYARVLFKELGSRVLYNISIIVLHLFQRSVCFVINSMSQLY